MLQECQTGESAGRVDEDKLSAAGIGFTTFFLDVVAAAGIDGIDCDDLGGHEAELLAALASGVVEEISGRIRLSSGEFAGRIVRALGVVGDPGVIGKVISVLEGEQGRLEQGDLIGARLGVFADCKRCGARYELVEGGSGVLCSRCKC